MHIPCGGACHPLPASTEPARPLREATLTMAPATPSELNPLAVIPARARSLPATVTSQVAAGIVGATVLCSAAGIEIARAWTTAPHVFAEAGHALGGVMVA